MPDLTSKLTADGLSMRFGRRVLFSDLSFEAVPGISLAITGRNGSGKSTLLKILAGVLEPTKGGVTLHVEGREVIKSDRPSEVGFVAPYLQLYASFSARENLEFLAQARRLPDSRGRIAAILERVGLMDRVEDHLSTFSTGMRQRLCIAAALLHDPPILLLDEPSASLDESGRELVQSIVALREKIIIVATNDHEEAALCTNKLDLPDRG